MGTSRAVILGDALNFASDTDALASHLRLHGLDPAAALHIGTPHILSLAPLLGLLNLIAEAVTRLQHILLTRVHETFPDTRTLVT
ncbi:MAG: hypothetical protein HZA93_15820 [Verrucomicrobia bacterium]|nr:hypothetical protein [Verrucomicrobiota bacterium]